MDNVKEELRNDQERSGGQ